MSKKLLSLMPAMLLMHAASDIFSASAMMLSPKAARLAEKVKTGTDPLGAVSEARVNNRDGSVPIGRGGGVKPPCP